MPNIPFDNETSFNEPVTIKTIALTNDYDRHFCTINFIYYSIFWSTVLLSYYYAPLMAIWNLPANPYNLTEFSPDDQITLKLFLPIKLTDIFDSSDKLKRSILVKFQTHSPLLYQWNDDFDNAYYKIISLVALCSVQEKVTLGENPPAQIDDKVIHLNGRTNKKFSISLIWLLSKEVLVIQNNT